MSVNIIDLVKGYLTPSVIADNASRLGESESGVSKAISALLPIVLGGAVENGVNNPSLLDKLKGLATSGILTGLGTGASTSETGLGGILHSIFGDKVGSIVSTVSNYANIKDSSAQSLLDVSSGATLGTLGKYANENNLDQAGFSSLLNDQKSWISSLIPAGLSLGSLGLGSLFSNASASVTNAAHSVTDKVHVIVDDTKATVTRGGNSYTPPTSDNNGGGGGSIWKWLLPLILVGLAGWFLWKQCQKKDTTTTTTTTTDSTNTKKADSSTTTTTTATTKETTTIDLKGTKLQGFKGGIEDQMVQYLNSGKYATDTEDQLKTVWYNFDNVNFQMGKSDKLEPGSEGQIQNIAAILKAFPDAKIKIGGYTDKVGDEAKNVKLSQERADFIKAALTKDGVGSQIVEAKGYGSSQATVPATATDAERAVDRKMAVRFAK